MTSGCAHNPSPLAGEGGEHRDERCEPGEGADGSLGANSSPPHPTPRLRSASPSPARGEGKNHRNGASSSPPHPTPRLRSASPSPARGEGKSVRRPIVATPNDARALRRTMTDAERKLWRMLRSRQFEHLKFRRQVPVGPYVADFLCCQARLVIEVDGGRHAESARDKRRDRWFERNDFLVLRFWNNEVLTNLEGVSTAIGSALRGRANSSAKRGCEPSIVVSAKREGRGGS